MRRSRHSRLRSSSPGDIGADSAAPLPRARLGRACLLPLPSADQRRPPKVLLMTTTTRSRQTRALSRSWRGVLAAATTQTRTVRTARTSKSFPPARRPDGLARRSKSCCACSARPNGLCRPQAIVASSRRSGRPRESCTGGPGVTPRAWHLRGMTASRGRPLPLVAPSRSRERSLARCAAGEVMAVRHRERRERRPFHPESVADALGPQLARNFLEGS